MRQSWRETSFRNKNKDFNFILTKNTFVTNSTSNIVNSDFISAQTISADNIIYNDFSFNNLSFNTLFANIINTNNLTAENTTTNKIEANEITSNSLNAFDVSCTNVQSENFTVRNLIIDELDVSNLDVVSITANTITTNGDVSTQLTSLNTEFDRNNTQDVSISSIQLQITNETNRNITQDVSITLLDASMIFAFNKNITQDISISNLDASYVYIKEINDAQDVSINFLDISVNFAISKNITQDTSINLLIHDVSGIISKNTIQDSSINSIQQQITNETNRNITQDNSINILDLSVNFAFNRNNIQDISINKLDASYVYIKQINEAQDVSINFLANNGFSTETLTGPGQTTINGNISNTILQGSFSSITLQNGTTTNFIKQITNISSTTPITINGLFTENGSNTSSRGIEYRLKLRWSGTRWIVLDDNYFVNNSNGSIYTLRNVGINTTNPQYNLDVNGIIRCTNLTQTSDVRVKENINIIDNALNNLLQLRGVYFNYINNPNQREIGFIAQEVEEIFPELVLTGEMDGIKSLKYQNVVAILVEAIKELKSKYNNLLDDYNNLYYKLNEK